MSKIIPFVLAGAGSAAASVGGVYLIRGTSSGAPAEAPNLNFEDENTFKNELSKLKCVTDYFGSLGLDQKESTQAFPTDANYFGTSGQRSCLIINWKKDTYSDKQNKWTGGFKWLWTFVNGNKGFIVWSVSKSPSSAASKLDVTGKGYVLEKTSDTWKVKFEKAVQSNKSFEEATFDQKFPKIPSSFAGKTYSGDNDLGLPTKEDLKKVCVSTDGCSSGTTKTTTSTKGHWTWSSGSGESTLVSWHPNLSAWQTEFMGTEFPLHDKIQTLKGTWKEEVVSKT